MCIKSACVYSAVWQSDTDVWQTDRTQRKTRCMYLWLKFDNVTSVYKPRSIHKTLQTGEL